MFCDRVAAQATPSRVTGTANSLVDDDDDDEPGVAAPMPGDGDETPWPAIPAEGVTLSSATSDGRMLRRALFLPLAQNRDALRPQLERTLLALNMSVKTAARKMEINEGNLLDFLGHRKSKAVTVNKIARFVQSSEAAVATHALPKTAFEYHASSTEGFRARIAKAFGLLKLPGDLHVAHVIGDANGGAGAVENYLLLGRVVNKDLINGADHFFAFLAGESWSELAVKATLEQNPQYNGPTANELYKAGEAWFYRHKDSILASHPRPDTLTIRAKSAYNNAKKAVSAEMAPPGHAHAPATTPASAPESTLAAGSAFETPAAGTMPSDDSAASSKGVDGASPEATSAGEPAAGLPAGSPMDDTHSTTSASAKAPTKDYLSDDAPAAGTGNLAETAEQPQANENTPPISGTKTPKQKTKESQQQTTENVATAKNSWYLFGCVLFCCGHNARCGI